MWYKDQQWYVVKYDDQKHLNFNLLRATSGARNPNLNIGFKRMRGSYIALQWLEFSKKSRPSKYLSLGTLRTNEMKGRNFSTGASGPRETNTKQQ